MNLAALSSRPRRPVFAGARRAFTACFFFLAGSLTAADYTIVTTGNAIVVTDISGNGDTLSITEPAVGNIRFAAAGRTFSVDGGGPLSEDSGALPLAGVTGITVNAGAGQNTINFGTFSGANFPSLTVNGGTGDDTVNFNGDILFAADRNLDVDLQNDDASPGADTVQLAENANLVAAGSGTITVRCSRSVVLVADSSMETINGALTVEANQQATVTPGNFSGVAFSGGTLHTSGSAPLVVKGRGGNDASGYQAGVEVGGGGRIIGGTAGGSVVVTGVGGASAHILNRGVALIGAGALITSAGANVGVTGTGGSLGSSFDFGVSVIFGAQLRAGGAGSVMIDGTGAGFGDSNHGVEIVSAGSLVTTDGGPITILGTPGGGAASLGLYTFDSSVISTPVAGGNIAITADSMSLAATVTVSTLAAASAVTLAEKTVGTEIDLGGTDAAGTLGLTDAELDRISTANLIIGRATTAAVRISAAITPASAAALRLRAGTALHPAVAGTDVTLAGAGVVTLEAPLTFTITGPAAETGYPQLKVAGGVNLTGATLSLAGSFSGAAGNTFTLVENDGTDAIAGTFTGLPQGATLAWPGSSLLNARISYTGGDGNDVVLTLTSGLAVTAVTDAGAGSLRSALSVAAAQAGPDTVTFDPALGGGVVALAGEIVVNDATGAVTIDARDLPGGLTLSGGAGAHRLLRVAAGSTVALRALALTAGHGGGAVAAGEGGAIYNEGALSLERCTVSGNAAAIRGGGIASDGTLALEHCTLEGNLAPSGGAVAAGGAQTFTHCTVANNTATNANGGGGIFASSALTITHCIVAENHGPGGVAHDIAGGFVKIGANIVEATSGGAATGPGTILNADPRLTPLADHGGPTPTMSLLPGSPALDAAAVLAGLDTDQRGFPRVRDGDATAGALPDIGAYEAQAAPFRIGFNLGDAAVSGGDTLAPADLAGAPAFRQGNWNHLAGAGSGLAGDATSRTDADGATVAGLRLWWKGPATGHLAGVANTPDKKLMFGFLDSSAAGDGSAATDLFNTAAAQPYLALAGLPVAATLGGYRVVIYADTDDATGRIGKYWLTTNRGANPASVGAETEIATPLFSRDAADFAGTYMRASATADLGAATPAGNYLIFEGLAEADGFTVRAEEGSLPASAEARAPLNGVQFVRNEIVVVTTAADELDPVGTPGTGLSLREALRDAPNGGGIVFDPAVFDGEPADTINCAGASAGFSTAKSLTIDASNIPGGVTVNAAASSGNQKSVFTVAPAGNVTLLGLKLTGGYANGGAGGGGLVNRGNATLIGCQLFGNTAVNGGAATNHASESAARLTLRRCTVSGNAALGNGGGLFNWADGQPADLRLEDSAVTGNTASPTWYGGGLYNFSNTGVATILARQSTISGNTARYGAGCFNTSNAAGGSSVISFIQCTVAANAATITGGGFYQLQTAGVATASLFNTIFATNTAAVSADLFRGSGTVISNGGNLIGRTDATVAAWLASDQRGTNAAPLNPRLAPLGNYGGSTASLALLPTSPARNAGLAGLEFVSLFLSDQRGFPRSLGATDVGAYESGTFADYNAWAWETLPGTASTPQHAATFDFDGDGAINSGEWLALTNPNDNTSYFRVIETTVVAPNLEVTFPTVLNRHYHFEYSTDLIAWLPLAGSYPGTGGIITASVSPVPGATLFFVRVLVGP